MNETCECEKVICSTIYNDTTLQQNNLTHTRYTYSANCSSCFSAHRVLSIRCVYIAFSWRIDRQTIKMNKISVPVMLQLLLLLLIGVMLILTSAKDSLVVVSFRKSRKTQNGPVMCALDTPSNKISSSSLQSCSLACTHDVTCASFNIKDTETCDLYNYIVKSIAPISNCDNYQVCCCSIILKGGNGQFPWTIPLVHFPLPCTVRFRFRRQISIGLGLELVELELGLALWFGLGGNVAEKKGPEGNVRNSY